jgi:hypothetical protein
MRASGGLRKQSRQLQTILAHAAKAGRRNAKLSKAAPIKTY